MSTSASVSPVVVTLPRSTPSVRLSPSPSSPTTRSTLTSTPRTSSSRLSPSTTAPCSLPTTVVPSPRSSVVAVPVPATRSPTVKFLAPVYSVTRAKGIYQKNGGWNVMSFISHLTTCVPLSSWWIGFFGRITVVP